MNMPSFGRAGALALLAAAVFANTLPAQGFRSLDSDRAAVFPVTTMAPNGRDNGVPSLIIRDRQTWSSGNFRVAAGTSGRCNLVLEDGGELIVEDAKLQIVGDVYLRTGGTLQLIRTECEVRNSFARQFSYWWEGGHLYTKNTTIGGYETSSSQIANFWLNRGVWTARQTVVQHSGGILAGLRDGFAADPDLKGGTLDADGLYAGKSADAAIIWGHGDMTLRNSRFPLNIALYADRAGSASLDLTSGVPIQHLVMGDRNVHTALERAPVTAHIPGSPWRLELQNTIVQDWAVTIGEVKSSNPAFSVELRNAELVNLRALTEDLQGRPQLTGPWRTFYPAPRELSDLPTARAPGEHVIPQGCGVRIGNVTFRAPNNAPATIASWAFNFLGNANFTARGSMVVAEMFVSDRARATFEGSREFGAGMVAQTYDIVGDGQLTIRNATVGNDGSFGAAIFASARARVQLQDCVLKDVLLQTKTGFLWPNIGVNQATITANNTFQTGALSTRSSRTGSIDLMPPAPTQNTSLDNLDFEGSVSSGRPDFWAVSGVNGSRSGTRRRGVASFGYRSSAATGGMTKRITAPPGTTLEFGGWLRRNALPGNASLEAYIQGSSGSRVAVTPTLTAGAWTYFRTAAYEVRSNDATVTIGLAHRGASSPVDVLCDEFDVTFASWWQIDNFGNLGMDEPLRDVGAVPRRGTAPNHWKSWQLESTRETSDRRPGSGGAGASLRGNVTTPSLGYIRKELSFMEPGVQVRVRGWVKPIGGQPVRVLLSELNSRAFDPNYGNNVNHIVRGTAWQSFDLTYTVPSASLTADFSAITIGASADFLVDDLSVEIL